MPFWDRLGLMFSLQGRQGCGVGNHGVCRHRGYTSKKNPEVSKFGAATQR